MPTSAAPGRRAFRAAVPAIAAASLLAAGLTTATSAQATPLPQAPGTVYVADSSSNKVVAFPPDGGAPTTVTDDVGHPTGLTLDDAGNLFIADAGKGNILEVPADGSAPTVVASGLSVPLAVAVDDAGDIFVANHGTDQVLKFAPGNPVPTPVGVGLTGPTGVAVNNLGDVFIADPGASKVYEVPGDGGPQHSVGVGLSGPRSVAIEDDDYIMVTDNGNDRVVEIEPADDDTFDIGLNRIDGDAVYVDGAGDVYVAWYDRIVEKWVGGAQAQIYDRSMDPSGVAAIAPDFPNAPPANASKGTPYSFSYGAYDATGAAPSYKLHSGTLPPGLTLDSATGQLSGTPTTPGSYTSVVENTTNHTLSPATTINVSGPGTLFISQHTWHGDGTNRVVQRVSDGDPLQRVGTKPPIYVVNGQALDAAGNMFIAQYRQITAVPANGTPPYAIGHHINAVSDVAVDDAGNIYIADTRHHRVVRVPARGGTQTTVGKDLHRPISVAVDGDRNVYVLSASGKVVKLAAGGGGPTKIARGFDCPLGAGAISRCPEIAAAANGDLYVADPKRNRVVKIPANGDRRHKIGHGFNRPAGVSVDAAGNVYVADTANRRVVKLPAGGGQHVLVRHLLGVVDVDALAR